VRLRISTLLVASLLVLAAACTGSDAADSADTPTSGEAPLTIDTLSTRPEYVTGGDVVVRVSGANREAVTLSRDGTDISDVLQSDSSGGWTGLVTDLTEGSNTLVARQGDDEATLEVVNHPTTGPLFAGPHLEPYVCTAERLGLGPVIDDDCSAPTKTSWSYITVDDEVKPLDDPSAPLPADVAMVVRGDVSMPFVVRVEQGVINRGVYWIWVLDPSPATEQWDPSGWNERLVFRFGGGCGTQYSQGLPLLAQQGFDPDLLARGYAVTTNTLTTFQSNCNDALTAEAALMTKEHFVEQYGVPEFTIGDGGSGGAIQQLLVAQNYPGILDGISPSLPFPDAITIASGVTDCGLMQAWFTTPEAATWSDEQRAAVAGNATPGTCAMWDRLFVSGVNPRVGCDPSLADQVYDPVTRPQGVRCTLQDINVAVYGRDPATGFARRALGNVGVQYGLKALADGQIDIEQFIAINEGIGSFDIDGNIVPTRTAADLDAVATSFRSGRVVSGGPLHDVPIVLRDIYTDDLGDIHTRMHAFTIRERLRAGDTDAPNLLLWTQPAGGADLIGALMGDTGSGNGPIFLIDQWLTTMVTTDPALPTAERLQRSKPGEALQRCVLEDGSVISGGWEIYDEPGPCRDAYPVLGDPRTVAGAPPRNDVLACALEPLDPNDYPVPLDPAQRDRLAAVFPDGVCDWSQPSVAIEPLQGPWLSFAAPD
jgi:hypothetical protein